MSSGSATSIRLSGATIVTRQKPSPDPDPVPGTAVPVVVVVTSYSPSVMILRP
jgi:hypothetical protein